MLIGNSKSFVAFLPSMYIFVNFTRMSYPVGFFWGGGSYHASILSLRKHALFMLTYEIVLFLNTTVDGVLFRCAVPKNFAVLTGRKTPPVINLSTVSACPVPGNASAN